MRIAVLSILLGVMICTPHRVAVAQNAYARFVSPVVGKARPSLQYDFSVSPAAAVEGQASQRSFQTQQLSAFAPLWQNESTEVGFVAGVRTIIMEGAATLPDTGDALPEQLTDVRFGPVMRHRFRNNWISGFNVQFGSASDVPFQDAGDLEYIGNWFLRIPHGDLGAWIIFLNYSNNREFLRHIPMPAFGFSFERGRWFQGFVGAPVMFLNFFPREKVNLSVTYLPITNVTAQLGYDPWPFFRIFSQFAWRSAPFFRNGRQIEDRRLFFMEKRIGAGLRLRPARWAQIRLWGGWAFDRFFYEGRSVLRNRSYNRINLSGAPFAAMQIGFRFGVEPGSGAPHLSNTPQGKAHGERSGDLEDHR